MRFSRFERKIFVAITAVALVPMLGALWLGQRALREAYEVGVNPRVRRELERGLELYRDRFAVLRRTAGQAADSVAADHALITAVQHGDPNAARVRLDALLARYDNIAQARVQQAPTDVFIEVRREDRLGPGMRLLELERPLFGSTEQAVALTVAAPGEQFIAYQRAGELVEVFSRLQSSGELVSTFYLVVYMGFLLSTIATALAVGVALSRRVTRRVSLLAEATSRVGAGDLSVSVPSDDADEIGDLTKAFNTMVLDLRDSRGRIEYLQRISAWQEFARRLAHEIKNPLTPIQLAMQEVHRSYRGDDLAYRHRLEDARVIVEEEVATLRRLVGEFSAFARLPEVRLAPADLGEFLHDLARSLTGLVQEQAGGTQIRVECAVAQGELPVNIDAMMLKRAVDNLVRNAAEAIAQSRPAGTGMVRVSVRRDPGVAVLEVADDGPGVASPDSQRVFDPYYTTKGEGTGLGLAIVKKVVLEHGGTIECAASELGGAVFRIRLPERGARIARV
jgi:two-component system, NtrC family, nitrogen regulation sensor histidine kinase NtrY